MLRKSRKASKRFKNTKQLRQEKRLVRKRGQGSNVVFKLSIWPHQSLLKQLNRQNARISTMKSETQ